MSSKRNSSGDRIQDLRADWKHPTEIRFGAGRASELPDACESLGIRRALLVTDPGLARLPIRGRLVEANASRGIATTVFSSVPSDPDGESIRVGARAFLEDGYDGVIALGGGSPLDAGKAIALALAVGPGNIWCYTYGAPAPPIRKGRIPPIIAVPTTAGTGSEVNASAVITDTHLNVKRSLHHPDLMPSIVLADPTLTRRLIPFLTAATGMDALSHNLEALCNPAFGPMLDAVALQGIRYVKDWLPAAFREQKNLKARVYTMAASIMGAIAFEKGLGAMHAMAHAVGALFKTHHGRTVAVIMPYVLRFNRRRIRGKMAEVARFLDLPRYDATGVLQWILELRKSLGIPGTLAEMGVRDSDIPALVDRALGDANAVTNPVPLDRAGLERLFQWAVRGKTG